jgi:four helix bundle protein
LGKIEGEMAMKENIILIKSYKFALNVIEVYRDLVYKKKEFVLSKQFLKCGTSIGANLEESSGGQTDKDFFTKITISYKEARESHYWLRLLRDSKFLDAQISDSLLKDCEELIRILTAIQKTLKRKRGDQI